MNEDFIRENLSSLLSDREVKSKTGQTPGEWKLLNDEISHIHGMLSNIEFTVILHNDSNCLRISAKINRHSAKISNIEIEDI